MTFAAWLAERGLTLWYSDPRIGWQGLCVYHALYRQWRDYTTRVTYDAHMRAM